MSIVLHPALSSIQQIITKELGADVASAVFAEIAVSEAGDETPASDPVRWVWSYAWQRFAELAPALFAIKPTGIKHITGYQLAFLYGLRQEPEFVFRVSLSDSEESALRCGRLLLRNWTGLRGFSRPGIHYTWDERSLAIGCTPSFAEYANVTGASFDVFERLRRIAIYPLRALEEARRDDHPEAAVAALLLHEETHAALSLARKRARIYGRPLTSTVEEAATLLCEATIFNTLADEIPPDRSVMLRYVACLPSHLASGASLLAFADPRETATASDWARWGLELTRAVSQTADDDQALMVLNALMRKGWKSETWRRRLGLGDYWR